MTDETFPLADNLRFLRALIARPKNVGAVVPSGPALSRAIAGTESFPATMTLEIAGLKLRAVFDGEIRLQ